MKDDNPNFAYKTFKIKKSWTALAYLELPTTESDPVRAEDKFNKYDTLIKCYGTGTRRNKLKKPKTSKEIAKMLNSLAQSFKENDNLIRVMKEGSDEAQRRGFHDGSDYTKEELEEFNEEIEEKESRSNKILDRGNGRWEGYDEDEYDR